MHIRSSWRWQWWDQFDPEPSMLPVLIIIAMCAGTWALIITAFIQIASR